MKLAVDQEKKQAEIWLTRADQDDPDCAKLVKARHLAWAEQGYQVAVFCSGRGDLGDLTQGLVLHNRTATAGEPPTA